MKKMASLLIFGMLVVFWAILPTYVSTGALGGSRIPLPNDINIVAPDSSLREEIRALPRGWEGTWDSGLDVVFIIEKIDNKEAETIYARGSLSLPSRKILPKYERIPAVEVVVFEGKVTLRMSLTSEDGLVIKNLFYFDPSKPQILEGVSVSHRGRSSITMKKKTIDDM